MIRMSHPSSPIQSFHHPSQLRCLLRWGRCCSGVSIDILLIPIALIPPTACTDVCATVPVMRFTPPIDMHQAP